MVWYDIVVLAILLITTWRGAQRGLVTQLAWIAAIVLCFKFADTLAPSITPHIGVGEPGSRVRHWIAMFILFVGFSIAAFTVAWKIESTLQRAKLKDLDRFLGGAVGLLLGGLTVMIMTFFAVSWETTKPIVFASRTGLAACSVLHNIEPLEPEYFGDYLRTQLKRYREGLAGLHSQHGELGDGTSTFFDDHDHSEDDAGEFNLLKLGSDLADAFGDGETGSATTDGPTLDEIMRLLPQDVREGFGTQIQRQWSTATPDQRRHLLKELDRNFDFDIPDVVSDFLATIQSVDEGQGSGPRTDFSAMLNEIGDIYQDRNQIVQRTREHMSGIPVQVQESVIRDWHADTTMQSTDPDPLTNIQTRLDERILRQLERARVPLTELSFDVRQRLNRSRR